MLVDQHEILQIAERLREAVHAKKKDGVEADALELEASVVRERYHQHDKNIRELKEELLTLIGS